MFDRWYHLYLLTAACTLIELANTTVDIFAVNVLLPCEVQRCQQEQDEARALALELKLCTHSVAQDRLRD